MHLGFKRIVSCCLGNKHKRLKTRAFGIIVLVYHLYQQLAVSDHKQVFLKSSCKNCMKTIQADNDVDVYVHVLLSCFKGVLVLCFKGVLVFRSWNEYTCTVRGEGKRE